MKIIFISYAQNYEDVMLWRALKHVENGFYIDVGAQDPEIDSVTKAFYDRGWRGINIEPSLQWYKKLEHQRPYDVNLMVAASSKSGEQLFYDIPDTGLSTIEKSTAENHKNVLGYEYCQRTVQVETIKKICQKNNVSSIHFLKVDVEGVEKEVIKGIDFSVNRPWILIVEATLPNSQVENFYEWEEIVVGSRYDHVYSDGLNRFYLAEERKELLDAFKYPPNYFDYFVRASEHKQSQKIEEQSQKIEEQSHTLDHLHAVVNDINCELQSVYNSKSWRITKPLRDFNKGLKNTGKLFLTVYNSLLILVKRIIKKILKVGFVKVSQLPYIMKLAKSLLSKAPRLETKIKRIIQPHNQASFSVSSESYAYMTDTDNLTPRTRRIYADLKEAYNRQGKEVE